MPLFEFEPVDRDAEDSGEVDSDEDSDDDSDESSDEEVYKKRILLLGLKALVCDHSCCKRCGLLK